MAAATAAALSGGRKGIFLVTGPPVRIPDWPTVGKYRVDIQSFESVALPELQVRKGTHLFIIDEVGKMELFSQSFFPAVLRLLQSNIPLLASIPLGHHIPQVERLRSHPGAQIFTLNQRNRDAVKDDIYMQLLQALDVASV
ncbi:Cancer-related nucleoside-triphosphatase homolog [Linum perenne]